MQLNPSSFDGIYNEFHQSWNLERIEKMRIDEYANLDNPDSLSYWLEYGSKPLGQIGRVSLHKFEIWEPKNNKQFSGKIFSYDGTYAWYRSKGDTSDAAFQKIRENIIQTVKASQAGDWDAIESIDLHSISKWKIAFLFSDRTLFPVYSKRALLAISTGLGKVFNNKDSVADIQRYILSKKPEDQDVVSFAHETYTKFAEQRPDTRNFYLVGSKYGDGNGNDVVPVMPEFLKNNCIAIGFLDWVDFSECMGADSKKVSAWVDEHYTSNKPSLSNVRSYFKLLSKIKAGDIIAIKSQGSYGQLTIIGYAKVVEKGGTVYQHDEDKLGHHIHVEFLEAGFEKYLGLTYSRTIHRLSAEKHGEDFYKIFGWYTTPEVVHEISFDQDEDEDEIEVSVETLSPVEGYNEKDETPFERSATASVLVNRMHNIIQNRFIRYLENEYPNDQRAGEKGRIDARRENDEELFIYEIKPFHCVYSCIRSGIGQLFDYAHCNETSKKTKLVIVGPGTPDEKDVEFIKSIRNMLSVSFVYLEFDDKTLRANEY